MANNGKDTEDYISVTRKARFVIATRSNDVDQFNQTQYQTDFLKYSYSHSK
jgi:hypothetical protein